MNSNTRLRNRRLQSESLESRNLLTGFSASLVADFTPGPESSEFGAFESIGEHLVFNVNGDDLYSTDGTAEGTQLLNDNVELGRFPKKGERSMVFESAGQEVWHTDGTVGGTFKLFSNQQLRDIDILGEAEEFTLLDIERDAGNELYAVDLQRRRVTFLKRVSGSNATLNLVAHKGNRLLVSYSEAGNGVLLGTDGTVGGTVVLNSVVKSLSEADDHDTFWFSGESEVAGVTFLYETDGLTTKPLFEVPSSSRAWRRYNDRVVYFDAESLWATDGTSEGTFLLFDEIEPADDRGIRGPTWSYKLQRSQEELAWHAEIDGVLLFGHIDKIYRTDGTSEGTWLLHDGYYLGEFDGQHYITDSAEVVTTDGMQVFDSQGNVLRPEIPGLPPPPAYAVFFIDRDAILRIVKTSPRSGTLSVFVDGRFKEVFHDAAPDFLRFSFQRAGDTWYGVGVESDGSKKTLSSSQGNIITLSTAEELDDYELGMNARFEAGTATTIEGSTLFPFGRTGDQQLWSLNGGVRPELLGESYARSRSDPFEDVYQTETSVYFLRDVEGVRQVWASDGTSETLEQVSIGTGVVGTDQRFVVWNNGPSLVVGNTAETGQELWLLESSYDTTPYGGIRAELGVYSITEREDLSLQVDVGGASPADLQFDWDLNNDGVFQDAQTQSPTLSADQHAMLNIEKDGYQIIRVRISEADGSSIVESGLLRIENFAPTVQPLIVSDSAIEGQAVAISIDATDAGELAYDFDFGDGTILTTNESMVEHTYSDMGKYRINARVSDTSGSAVSTEHLLTVSPAIEGQTWVFEPGDVFGRNEQTYDVDLADSNNDGVVDKIYATVMNDWNEVWAINNGRIETTPTKTGNPDFIDASSVAGAVGDINNNGRLQSVVATRGSGLEGWNTPAVESQDVALGDLDQDGDLDLVVANYQRNGVAAGDWIFKNDRDGSLLSGAGFAPSPQELSTYESRSVELSDLDGDGDLDVVSAATDAIHIWMNNGLGQFTKSTQQIPLSGEHVAVGDLNGDGAVDLFVATNGANKVWINEGSGVFVDSGQSLAEANSTHVVLGDLDLDGDLDAAIGNTEGFANTIWINDGSGSFADSNARFAESKRTDRLALGDLDGDGDLDLVSASNGSPNHVYLNSTIAHDHSPPVVKDVQFQTENETVTSLTIEFSEEVVVANRQNFLLSTSYQRITPKQLTWNSERDTVTWDLSSNDVKLDEVTVQLLSDAITDRVGLALDGDANNLSGGLFSETTIVTFPGDVDQDFDVDFADFLLLSSNFGLVDASVSDGDTNDDGLVNFTDFLILSTNFGKTREGP